jgi:hypothetical protein
MLAVTNTIGDVASILFGVPGEPTLVATTSVHPEAGARERRGTSVAPSLGVFVFMYGLLERAPGVTSPPGSVLVWLGRG